MKQRSIYIFNFLLALWLLGAALPANGQKQKGGNVPQKKLGTTQSADTLRKAEPVSPATESEEEEEEFVRVRDTTNYPLLTEVQLFLDYGKLLTLPFGFERKFEGGAQLLLENRYAISLAYGHASIWPQNAYKNVAYNASGSYLKPGVYYQMTINPDNKISAGARFGLASFEDSGQTSIESGSGLFEPYERSFSRTNLSASWWELDLQSESRWRGNLWLGFRLSFRKLIDFDNPDDPTVFVVPGYGRTNTRSLPAVNLFLKYKFSFYKPPVPPAAQQ